MCYKTGHFYLLLTLRQKRLEIHSDENLETASPIKNFIYRI